MADLKNGSVQQVANGRFTVDADYLKQQAGEAFWTFIAPLSGMYGAVVRSDQFHGRSGGGSTKQS